MVCWSGQVKIKQEAVEKPRSSPLKQGDLTTVLALSKVWRSLKVRTKYWLCELGKVRRGQKTRWQKPGLPR